MDRTDPPPAAPAQAMRDEIMRLRKFVPSTMYWAARPLFDLLVAYVESVELRLSQLEGTAAPAVQPPAAVLAEVNRDRELARLALIIDDGLPARKHRKNIFNPYFSVAGAAFGRHAKFGTVCSMDFAGGYAERGQSTDLRMWKESFLALRALPGPIECRAFNVALRHCG